MLIGTYDIDVYNKQMEALKRLSRVSRTYIKSKEYKNGIKLKKLLLLMTSGTAFFKKFSIYLRNFFDEKVILPSKIKLFKREEIAISDPNYFSSERIAVYTCIFGKYDDISKPICYPNNIDYYIITDQDDIECDGWTKLDYDPFKEIINGFSNVEKNRWFKMHPHIVFPKYKYSIYLDGNVIPVTDLTEYVNRIGNSGIAMFWHNNNCVYQEALWNRYSIHKIKSKELNEHVQFLKNEGMPEDYGLTTCNVIARDHSNQLCKELMDDWWTEYEKHCKRDMISFPYVVWKKNIQMDKIATLGYCVWDDDSIIVKPHSIVK